MPLGPTTAMLLPLLDGQVQFVEDGAGPRSVCHPDPAQLQRGRRPRRRGAHPLAGGGGGERVGSGPSAGDGGGVGGRSGEPVENDEQARPRGAQDGHERVEGRQQRLEEVGERTEEGARGRNTSGFEDRFWLVLLALIVVVLFLIGLMGADSGPANQDGHTGWR
ncbi:hypothetical protein GCM10010282_53370 [Streptomyces roseolus]|nr:hypothetical protein GCM10010282_53370 [Streptomyces roseolus]